MAVNGVSGGSSWTFDADTGFSDTVAAQPAATKSAAVAQQTAPATPSDKPPAVVAAAAKPAAKKDSKSDPVVSGSARFGVGDGTDAKGNKLSATYQNFSVSPAKAFNLNESGSLNATVSGGARVVQAESEGAKGKSDIGYKAVNAAGKLNYKVSDKVTAYAEAGTELYYMNESNGKTGIAGADKQFRQVGVGANYKTKVTDKLTAEVGGRVRAAEFENFNAGTVTKTTRPAVTAKASYQVNDKTSASVSLLHEVRHNNDTGANQRVTILNPEVSRKVGAGSFVIGAEIGAPGTQKFDGDTGGGHPDESSYNVYAAYSVKL